jgi:hypothetical protein
MKDCSVFVITLLDNLIEAFILQDTTVSADSTGARTALSDRGSGRSDRLFQVEVAGAPQIADDYQMTLLLAPVKDR